MRLVHYLVIVLLFAVAVVHAETVAPTPPTFSGGTGGGATYHVNPSGSGSACTSGTPCSLNEGFSQVQPGETVLLQDGTYNQRLDTPRDGTAGNHIVIKAENKHLATVTAASFRTIWIKHNYITIDGLRVEDSGGSSSAAVSNSTAGGQHHIILENLHIYQADGVGIRLQARDNESSDWIIRHNLIDGTSYDAPGQLGSGIYIGTSDGGNPDEDGLRFVIHDNEIRDFASNCIDFKSNVFQAWAYNNTCHNDTFRGLAQDGIFQIQGSEIYVYNNTVYDIDDNGPLFMMRKSNTGLPNLAYNNVAYNSSDLSVFVKTLNGNSGALPVVFNNTLFQLGGYTIDENNFPITIINNIGPSRANNLSVPDSNYFVDAANGDFNLTVEAVNAIDQATNEPFSGSDIEGVSAQGGARDYGAYEFDVATITSFFGPSRASIGTDGTILSTTDSWQSTLEGASSGTYRLNAGTYTLSGTLNIAGIKLATNNGADVTLVGHTSIEGSNTTIEGLKIDADGTNRCIEVIRDNESTGWTGIVIQANQIFGGRGGDCVRVEGNIQGMVIKDNYIDGGGGPDVINGVALNILGGCTRSGDDVTTPFTYTCRPEGTIIEHNLFSKTLANHPTWGSWGPDTDDALQLQGQGNTTVDRNVFWELDSDNEEYIDIKTAFAGTTTTFKQNYIYGLGMNHDKSCMIVQGDWDQTAGASQFILQANLFDRCAQNFDQRSFRGGVGKPYEDHHITLDGNIFNCAISPGDDIVFTDIVTFSAFDNTIDNCQISGATISSSTNAFDDWQGTHANGANNPLTLGMANGDFSLFHATASTVFSPIVYYGDAANYTELNPSRWHVIDDGGDFRYGLNTTSIPPLSGNRLGEYALVGQQWGDFKITFEARSTENLATNPQADFAVPFAFQDANNYAYLLVNSDTGFTAFFVIESGVRSAIVSHPAPVIVDNNYHDVELTRTGDRVVFKYDDVVILDATNTRLGAIGDLGYGTFNDASLMDNFNVQSLTISGTFYVKTTGTDTDCTTIQTDTTPALTIGFAYACASADNDLSGDEIRLGTGEWNESVAITHNGSQAQPFLLTAIVGEFPIIDGTGVTSPATRALLDLGSSQYITVSNLTVRDESTEDCIEYSGVGVHIDNLTVDNCGSTGILFISPPIQPTMSRITNNTITNTNSAGISCFNAPDAHVLIEGNSLSTVATTGGVQGAILGFDCAYAYVSENTIFDISSGAESIIWRSPQEPSLSHHVVIDDNLIYRGATGIAGAALRLHGQNTRTIVRRNRLFQRGIEIEGPLSTPDNTVVIYHNTSIDAGKGGAASGVHALSLNNSFNAYQGLQLINNAWIESDGDLLNHGPLAVDGGSSAIWSERNAYKFSAGTGITWWSTGGENTYTGDVSGLNSWRSDHNKDQSGSVFTTLDQNELFANVATFDFTPASGSPLIDAGGVLTLTASAGSGTSIPVLNSSFFSDGFGLVAGDQIQIGGGSALTIIDIVDGANTLVVSPSESWTAGQGVTLLYSGSAPDIGAVESGLSVALQSGYRLGGHSTGGRSQ